LAHHYKEGGEDDSSQFNTYLLVLRNYCLVSVSEGSLIFEMHALVQLATRKWLEVHGQLGRWRQQFIRNLCKEFPTGDYENWAVCQALFPHAKSAMAQRPDEQDALRD
jgi:hypothetical protein